MLNIEYSKVATDANDTPELFRKEKFIQINWNIHKQMLHVSNYFI